MKLSTAEDIDLPAPAVFAAMSDFESFETRMRDRKIDVARMSGPIAPEIGAAWSAPINWRGKRHEARATLITFEPDTSYAIEGQVGGVVSMAVVDLVALARSKTRMFVSLELTPTSLSSRLLLQSLKLTKGTLSKKFKEQVAGLADEIRASA